METVSFLSVCFQFRKVKMEKYLSHNNYTHHGNFMFPPENSDFSVRFNRFPGKDFLQKKLSSTENSGEKSTSRNVLCDIMESETFQTSFPFECKVNFTIKFTDCEDFGARYRSMNCKSERVSFSFSYAKQKVHLTMIHCSAQQTQRFSTSSELYVLVSSAISNVSDHALTIIIVITP